MKRNFLSLFIGLAFIGGLLINTGCDTLVNQDTGFLEGRISIGPICPVEKDPPDPGCLPTAETYKAYPVGIWTYNHKKEITQISAAPDGSYSVELKPGRYLIILETGTGSIGSSNLPVEISILPGNITYLDIDIDTGIR